MRFIAIFFLSFTLFSQFAFNSANAETAPIVPIAFNFDIDGDGQRKPLTDGLLILRYLFGFRGESLISKAVGNGATRSTASQIETYLNDHLDHLDIDGNGESKPLSDGLMVLRYFFGFRGDTLVNQAVAVGATRKTAEDVEDYLQKITESTSLVSLKIQNGSMQKIPFTIRLEDTNQSESLKWYLDGKPITLPHTLEEEGSHYLTGTNTAGDKSVSTQVSAISPQLVSTFDVIPGSSKSEYIFQNKNSFLSGVSLYVPKGAVSVDTTISIKESNIGNIPNTDGIAISKLLTLEPSGLQLDKPIVIHLPYEGDVIPENIVVVNYSDGGILETVKPLYVDEEKHEVVFTTDHFTDFVLQEVFLTFIDKPKRDQTEIQYIETLLGFTNYTNDEWHQILNESIDGKDFTVYDLLLEYKKSDDINSKIPGNYADAIKLAFPDSSSAMEQQIKTIESVSETMDVVDALLSGGLSFKPQGFSTALTSTTDKIEKLILPTFASLTGLPTSVSDLASVDLYKPNLVVNTLGKQFNKIDNVFYTELWNEFNTVFNLGVDENDFMSSVFAPESALLRGLMEDSVKDGLKLKALLTSEMIHNLKLVYLRHKNFQENKGILLDNIKKMVGHVYNADTKKLAVIPKNDNKYYINSKFIPSFLFQASGYGIEGFKAYNPKLVLNYEGHVYTFNKEDFKPYSYGDNRIIFDETTDDSVSEFVLSKTVQISAQPKNVQMSYQYTDDSGVEKEGIYNLKYISPIHDSLKSYDYRLETYNGDYNKSIYLTPVFTENDSQYIEYKTSVTLGGRTDDGKRFVLNDSYYEALNNQDSASPSDLEALSNMKITFSNVQGSEYTFDSKSFTLDLVSLWNSLDKQDKEIDWSTVDLRYLGYTTTAAVSTEDEVKLVFFDGTVRSENIVPKRLDVDGNGIYDQQLAENSQITTFKFPGSGIKGPSCVEFQHNISKEERRICTSVKLTLSDGQVQENNPPTGKIQSITLSNGEKISIDLFGYDADKDNLTYRITTNPKHGSIISLVGNKVTYDPGASFYQSDKFTDGFNYVVNDGIVDSRPKFIRIKKVETVENQSPTVTLSSGQAFTDGEKHSFLLKPISVTDEDIEGLSYQWSVVWTGTAGNYQESANGNSLTLNIPDLFPGQQGSAKVTVTVSDFAGETATDTATYSYGLAKVEGLEFIGDDFTDGSILERGSSKTLTWTVKNAGNVDLNDVELKPSTQLADNLTVSSISPALIASWPVGVSKTFSVSIDVPNTVTAGTHRQEWNFFYGNNQALPYLGQTVAAPLFFEFNTDNPNDLVGRLIINSSLIEPAKPVSATIEITSGNEPYALKVNWGDGSIEDFTGLTSIDGKMTKVVSHTYNTEGTYSFSAEITDFVSKKATYRDSIKVAQDVVNTAWKVDVHDIVTNETAEDIPFSSALTQSNSQTIAVYSTNWIPGNPTSEEYFVKYRLPVPPGLLNLDKKLKITSLTRASDIADYDREIAFKTNASKEYTTSVRDINNSEGGYIRIRDISTGEVSRFLKPALVDDVKNTKDYAYTMEVMPAGFDVFNTSTGQKLASYDDNLGGNWITELDFTFKGNGQLRSALLEYDLNGDGEFGSDERLVLNTHDKSVNWSVFGAIEPINEINISLKQCINATLEIADTEIPTQTQLNSITDLYCNLAGISGDLSALSGLTNLTSLHLEGQGDEIADTPAERIAPTNFAKRRVYSIDINALSALVKLKIIKINFMGYQILNFAALSGLSNLTTLSMSGFDQVTDISALSGPSNLTTLSMIGFDQVTDISVLSGLSNLTTLSMNGFDQVIDISALSGLSKLTTVSMSGFNQVTDISALSNLVNLDSLSLTFYGTLGADAEISIGSLSGLTNLTSLYLSGGNIKNNLASISKLTKLTRLSLGLNLASIDFSVLSNLPNLNLTIHVSDDDFLDIRALSALQNVTSLSLSRYPGGVIVNLSDLSIFPNLLNLKLGEFIYLDINELSGLINLQSLDLSYSDISDISALAGLTDMRVLNLEGNAINDISGLSAMTNLTYLNLSFNNVIDVSPLENLLNLIHLDLFSNCISDFSKLPASLGEFDAGWQRDVSSCSP